MAIIDQEYIEKLKYDYDILNAKMKQDAELYAKNIKELNKKFDGLKEQFLKLDDLQQKCLTYIQTMVQASDYSKKIWAEDIVKPKILLTPDDLRKQDDERIK